MKRVGIAITDFFKGYFNFLLVSLVCLFIFRPYHREGLYMGIWQFLFIAVFFSSIFNCKHPRYIVLTSLSLGIPTIILSWVTLIHRTPFVITLYLIFALIFILICAGSIIFRVVLNARVTLNTLKGVVSAYFMLAFAFAYCYYLIEILFPGSFHIAVPELNIAALHSFLSEMMYFSFVTLLTIGYGDIIAVRDISQTFTILEGVIGQFYIAILVARLVSVYSFLTDKKMLAHAKKAIKEQENQKTIK